MKGILSEHGFSLILCKKYRVQLKISCVVKQWNAILNKNSAVYIFFRAWLYSYFIAWLIKRWVNFLFFFYLSNILYRGQIINQGIYTFAYHDDK